MQARAAGAAPDFRAVFEDNFRYVWNSLRQFGVHPNDLEDLAHEVFLRVHERFDECDHSRPLRPWLCAFAFRVASGHRRLARHRLEIPEAEWDVAADAPSAHDEVTRKEDQALALQVLEGVPLERRAVFLLHEIDGYSIPEIAHALGIQVATAYSRLRVARQECEAAVQRLQRTRGDR